MEFGALQPYVDLLPLWAWAVVGTLCVRIAGGLEPGPRGSACAARAISPGGAGGAGLEDGEGGKKDSAESGGFAGVAERLGRLVGEQRRGAPLDDVSRRFLASAVVLAIDNWPRPAGAPPRFKPGSLPVVGNFVEFARNPTAVVRRGYDELGPAFTMSMLGQNLTFVLGATAHKNFFEASDEEVGQAEAYRFMTPVFGNGIVYDSPQPVMQQQLRFMSKSLKTDALKTYVPKIIRETEDYFKAHWGDEGEVNLMEMMSELTILTASRCLMGDEIRERLFERVASLYHDLDAGITALSVFFPNAPIPQHFTRNKARKAMVEVFSGVIQERRAHPEVKHEDVLQSFMDAEYRDGTTLNDEQITGLLIALLFAGQHTSSITATWTLLLTLHHPEILRRVLAEQEAVVNGAGVEEPGVLDMAKVGNMNELYRCMKEALRMFPPLIFLMRFVKKPHIIEDEARGLKYTVPVGDILFASPAVSHRLPQGPDSPFTNPDKFDPDRYVRGEDASMPRSYIGFGSGKHSCMGENFAYLQVRTILSTILRNFTLTPLSDLPPADYSAIVVGPLASMTRVRYQRIKPGARAAGGAAAAAAAAAGGAK